MLTVWVGGRGRRGSGGGGAGGGDNGKEEEESERHRVFSSWRVWCECGHVDIKERKWGPGGNHITLRNNG